LSDSERKRLLETCRQSFWDRLYLVVLLAITTGARRSELLGLKWHDIDWQNETAFVSDTKNSTSKVLHLIPPVIAELNRFKDIENKLVFESPNIPGQALDFRKPWNAALKIAAISQKDVIVNGKVTLEKFTFHSLRHSFCSALSDSGHELGQIAELAGHKSIQTTRKYIHSNESENKKLINKLASKLDISYQIL
jgi:integrase